MSAPMQEVCEECGRYIDATTPHAKDCSKRGNVTGDNHE